MDVAFDLDSHVFEFLEDALVTFPQKGMGVLGAPTLSKKLVYLLLQLTLKGIPFIIPFTKKERPPEMNDSTLVC